MIDVFSRMIVGWQLASNMRTTLVLDALRMALGLCEHGADVQLVAHSDAGSQYTSSGYTQTLDDHLVLASIGSVGDCYDNALAESFVDTYKTELIAGRVWRTRTELELATVEWVAWFNTTRLQGSLGDIPHVEYEALHTPLPAGADSAVIAGAGVALPAGAAGALPAGTDTAVIAGAGVALPAGAAGALPAGTDTAVIAGAGVALPYRPETLNAPEMYDPSGVVSEIPDGEILAQQQDQHLNSNDPQTQLTQSPRDPVHLIATAAARAWWRDRQPGGE